MLQKYTTKERIVFFDEPIHKQQALIRLMDCITSSDKIIDPEKFRNGILERENIMSTGIGLGVAVPHTYSDAVTDIVIAVGVSREGINDFGSMDDKPVHFIIMVAAGSHQHREYLQILARVAMLAKNEKTKTALLAAQSKEEILAALPAV